jgi:hypothetical protein
MSIIIRHKITQKHRELNEQHFFCIFAEEIHAKTLNLVTLCELNTLVVKKNEFKTDKNITCRMG